MLEIGLLARAIKHSVLMVGPFMLCRHVPGACDQTGHLGHRAPGAEIGRVTWAAKCLVLLIGSFVRAAESLVLVNGPFIRVRPSVRCA